MATSDLDVCTCMHVRLYHNHDVHSIHCGQRECSCTRFKKLNLRKMVRQVHPWYMRWLIW